MEGQDSQAHGAMAGNERTTCKAPAVVPGIMVFHTLECPSRIFLGTGFSSVAKPVDPF